MKGVGALAAIANFLAGSLAAGGDRELELAYYLTATAHAEEQRTLLSIASPCPALPLLLQGEPHISEQGCQWR